MLVVCHLLCLYVHKPFHLTPTQVWSFHTPLSLICLVNSELRLGFLKEFGFPHPGDKSVIWVPCLLALWCYMAAMWGPLPPGTSPSCLEPKTFVFVPLEECETDATSCWSPTLNCTLGETHHLSSQQQNDEKQRWMRWGCHFFITSLPYSMPSCLQLLENSK